MRGGIEWGVRMFIICSLAIQGISAGYGCKGELGEDLDWYIIYKLPRSTQPATTTPGKNYTYISSASATAWIRSTNEIGSTQSMLHRTLAGPISTTSERFYSYNDQLPTSAKWDANNTTAATYAHTKGFIAIEDFATGGLGNGVWLSHSVPKFLPMRGKPITYPPTGERFGQVIFCLSLKPTVHTQTAYDNMVNGVREYLLTVRPNCGNSHCIPAQPIAPGYNPIQLTDFLRPTALGNLRAVIRNGVNTGVGGILTKDIYADRLTNNPYVQTWRPTLVEPTSTNVGGLSMVTSSGAIYRWNGGFTTFNPTSGRGSDHSKWAVGRTGSTVCIGDLNKFNCNELRDGGMICFENTLIHARFLNLIPRANFPGPDDAVDDPDADKCYTGP